MTPPPLIAPSLLIATPLVIFFIILPILPSSLIVFLPLTTSYTLISILIKGEKFNKLFGKVRK